MIRGICSLLVRTLRLSALRVISVGVILCIGAQCALADVDQLEIKLKDQAGMLNFELQGVKREQVSLHLKEGKNALLKIVVSRAKISSKKYWIRTFAESRSDADIKGIMVRRLEQDDKVEIRVRYRRAISQRELKRVSVTSSPQGVKVVSSRKLGEGSNAKSESSQTPKPTLDPKLDRIRQVSSALNDDTPPKASKAKRDSITKSTSVTTKSVTPTSGVKQKSSSTQPQRPSVFEQGTPSAPLPRTDAVRPVGSPIASNPVTPLPELSSPRGLDTLPKTSLSSPKLKEGLALTGSSPAPADPAKSDVLDDTPGSMVDSLNLDEMSELIAYILVFILLVWLARFFLKRGKDSARGQMDNSIKVVSQTVVNLSPRQRVMVVEVKGHTIVVGACDRSGLSHLAHLSTPLGPVGAPAAPSGGMGGGLDALSHLSSEPYTDSGYYHEDQYVRSDSSYSHVPADLRSDPVQPMGFEESTFVGNEEEEVFTVEVPIVAGDVQLEHDRMSNVDSYAMGETPRALATPASAQVTTPPVALGEASDEEVKPENLLQLIQKLNNSKS